MIPELQDLLFMECADYCLFFSFKKEIDAVAEELEKNGQNIAADQREE